MNETVQLLQDVVRNARTGRDAVEQLLNKADGGRMREELNKEKAEYLQTQKAGEKALADAGGHADPSARDLANRFVAQQNAAIERQKGFLRNQE